MTSWEEKFNNLLQEYSLLSAEHNQLKLSQDRLKKYCRFLEEEIVKIRQEFKGSEINENSNYLEDKVSVSLDSLKTADHIKSKPARFVSNEVTLDVPAKALIPMKTPQPMPDNGADSETSSGIFEAFFVVGVKSCDLDSQEDILYEYPPNNLISKAMKNVIPSLALPKKQVKELKLTGSASDLNNLIFGQIPLRRNENCFVFTLRNEKIEQDTVLETPNSNHEVVYFTCILIEDITEKNGTEYITNKSYCLASFVPAFDLHYETLCSILLLKRLHRMDLMLADTSSPTLSNINITEEGVELLQELAKIVYFDESLLINVKTRSMDCLKYQFPDQLKYLDIPWLCIPLFSSLKFEDLCWLVSALVQEKSVIFISTNLGLLTSAVLALRALIRPLNWLNLTVPLIPDNLREIMEAPVPILAGTTHMDAKMRYKYSNIIWVLLDESNINYRVQVSRNSEFDVIELHESIMTQIRKNYNFRADSVFEMNLENKEAALKIASIFYNYWKHILGKFSNQGLRKNDVQKMVKKFPHYEQNFVNALIQTQIFANSAETKK